MNTNTASFQTHFNRFAPIALAVFAVASGALFAGSLNPPAGTVTSTMKSLGDVEPRVAINATNTPGDANSVYKITQPGSYYLTSSVNVLADFVGIEVATGNVTRAYPKTAQPGGLRARIASHGDATD